MLRNFTDIIYENWKKIFLGLATLMMMWFTSKIILQLIHTSYVSHSVMVGDLHETLKNAMFVTSRYDTTSSKDFELKDKFKRTHDLKFVSRTENDKIITDVIKGNVSAAIIYKNDMISEEVLHKQPIRVIDTGYKAVLVKKNSNQKNILGTTGISDYEKAMLHEYNEEISEILHYRTFAEVQNAFDQDRINCFMVYSNDEAPQYSHNHDVIIMDDHPIVVVVNTHKMPGLTQEVWNVAHDRDMFNQLRDKVKSEKVSALVAKNLTTSTVTEDTITNPASNTQAELKEKVEKLRKKIQELKNNSSKSDIK